MLRDRIDSERDDVVYVNTSEIVLNEADLRIGLRFLADDVEDFGTIVDFERELENELTDKRSDISQKTRSIRSTMGSDPIA